MNLDSHSAKVIFVTHTGAKIRLKYLIIVAVLSELCVTFANTCFYFL
jgi:hypothetical protein